MKHFSNLIIVCIMILFSFCKKKDPPANNSSVKTSKEAQAVSYMVRGGTWIWDSTVFYNGSAAVYCYTKDQLKTYTSGTTVISCTTSSTFSLSMTNDPYNNTGDGIAYANTYDEYAYSWDQHMGQMQLKSVYKNANDSTINLEQTWGWLIGQNQNGTNIDVYLKGTTTSLHKCSTSIGYVSFGSATYIVKDISANLFVFQQPISPATNCNQALYYFHK